MGAVGLLDLAGGELFAAEAAHFAGIHCLAAVPHDELGSSRRQSQQCSALDLLEDLDRTLGSGSVDALASDIKRPAHQLAREYVGREPSVVEARFRSPAG